MTTQELLQLGSSKRLDAWLSEAEAELKFVLHHRSDHALSQHNTPTSVDLLIGPEGGLSESEISHAESAGFKPLRLGPRVMRTETAPLAAVSVMQYLWGDFG